MGPTRGSVFDAGVASGDPTAEGAVIWTHVATDQPQVAVTWSVHLDGLLVRSGDAVAAADRDHCVHVEVAQLGAGRRYSYRFEVDGERSPEGWFRTLPTAERTDGIRFGVACCVKHNAGFFSSYRHLAERDDLQFVLHLGDYIYEAANTPPTSQTPGADIGRDFDPLHECRTLDDYRRRYAQYRRDADLQALHAAHAVIATIDDHELADNAWSGGAEEHRDAEHGLWAVRRQAALRAWEEWMPTRRHPGTLGEEIHRSFSVGDLCRVALLETRTHRTSPAETDPDVRTELGAEQRAWLEDEVRGSTERWFVLGAPSTITPLWSDALDDEAKLGLETLKLIDPKTDDPFRDLWDKYPVERRWLLDLLGQRPDVLVVCGDVHASFDAVLTVDGRPVATEWTSGSITSQSLADKLHWEPRTRSLACEAGVVAAHPDIRACNFDEHGYLLVDLGPDGATGEWWYADTVLEPGAGEHLGHTSTARRSGPAT